MCVYVCVCLCVCVIHCFSPILIAVHNLWGTICDLQNCHMNNISLVKKNEKMLKSKILLLLTYILFLQYIVLLTDIMLKEWGY